MRLNSRPLPPRHDQCQFCHLKKNRLYIKGKKTLKKEHADISLQHGRLEASCNSCHDNNNHNFLRASTTLKASFKNSSPVCQRCHAEQYRDWTSGIHGKRTGGWYQSQVQYNCIDCHSPHSVRFKPMVAERPPMRPQYGIAKNHEGHGGEAEPANPEENH